MRFTDYVRSLIEGNRPLASFRLGEERIELAFGQTKTIRGVEARIEGQIFPESDALSWVLYLKNAGSENSESLSDILSADLWVPADQDERVLHAGIRGDFCSAENFLPFEQPLCPGGQQTVHSVGGRSSSGAFPTFELRGRADGMIAAIGWSGQWQYALSRSEETVNLNVGLEKACFYLKPGEEVRLPRVLLKSYEGDPTDGQVAYRRLLFDHFVPRRASGAPLTLPAAIQCFDRYSWSLPKYVTEAGQKEYAACAERLRYLDTVWLDAAWFEGAFPFGVGNYKMRSGFPNGLRPISDATRRMGMQFMLWFEPERITYGTEMDQLRPEWVLNLPSRAEIEAWPEERRRQVSGLYNLGDPEALRFLLDRLTAFIRKEGIDRYRQDFNFDPLEYWRAYDEPGRTGLCEIHYIMGFYALWDGLRAAFPDMLIDNCAGGGRRIDLETCMRSVPLWRSDTGCSPVSEGTPSDMWNQNQSICLSRYLPYHAIAAWRPDAYEFRSAATNGIAAQFAVFDDDFDEKAAIECLKEFDRIKPYWLGDFYPLTPATLDDTSWAAFQLNRKDLSAGAVMVFRRPKSPYETARFALRSLDEKGTYRLILSDENRKITEKTVPGADLLTGFAVTLTSPRSSLCIEYRKI